MIAWITRYGSIVHKIRLCRTQIFQPKIIGMFATGNERSNLALHQSAQLRCYVNSNEYVLVHSHRQTRHRQAVGEPIVQYFQASFTPNGKIILVNSFVPVARLSHITQVDIIRGRSIFFGRRTAFSALLGQTQTSRRCVVLAINVSVLSAVRKKLRHKCQISDTQLAMNSPHKDDLGQGKIPNIAEGVKHVGCDLLDVLRRMRNWMLQGQTELLTGDHQILGDGVELFHCARSAICGS
ncbi:hypothetical protein HD553DRAFT_323770 [Filobasidium floriforme]|uniref:uncharacterized protein n=1 Tax=Filobasidium floriforme TaxID=5210 RepID=UPI001E8CE6B5|nr:uncharacterized protein HD553DRAFT_323770 [Filobasidium floriforme]KAH8085193.1 hypothetical protein HD553DRAFT_323770 [Filobasidium floriforme]